VGVLPCCLAISVFCVPFPPLVLLSAKPPSTARCCTPCILLGPPSTDGPHRALSPHYSLLLFCTGHTIFVVLRLLIQKILPRLPPVHSYSPRHFFRILLLFHEKRSGSTSILFGSSRCFSVNPFALLSPVLSSTDAPFLPILLRLSGNFLYQTSFIRTVPHLTLLYLPFRFPLHISRQYFCFLSLLVVAHVQVASLQWV